MKIHTWIWMGIGAWAGFAFFTIPGALAGALVGYFFDGYGVDWLAHHGTKGGKK